MSYGINLSNEGGFNSVVGCVTTCDHPDCHAIATKYYIKGEDTEFFEMYEKTIYPKVTWIKGRVLIIGFCDEHKQPSRDKSSPRGKLMSIEGTG